MTMRPSTPNESIRPAAVAGAFYPGSAASLRAAVEKMLADAVLADERRPVAVIVPHAGYVYSGPIAATAYKQVALHANTYRRVVLLGPAHYVALSGLALPSSSTFETPLGNVQLGRAAMEKLLELPQVGVSAAAHAREHSLEVQLPFLQIVLGSFELVPVVVGHAPAEDVAEAIDALWSPGDTLLVVSSDLSHHLSYESALHIDERTAQSIVSLSAAVESDDACGAYPVNGLLSSARARGLTAKLLDLRNSGDTAGDRSRVVGYGAFCFA